MGFELRGSQAEVKSLQNRTRRKGGKSVKAARAFAEPRITHFLDISAKNDDSWGETPSGEAISWASGSAEAPPNLDALAFPQVRKVSLIENWALVDPTPQLT